MQQFETGVKSHRTPQALLRSHRTAVFQPLGSSILPLPQTEAPQAFAVGVTGSKIKLPTAARFHKLVKRSDSLWGTVILHSAKSSAQSNAPNHLSHYFNLLLSHGSSRNDLKAYRNVKYKVFV